LPLRRDPNNAAAIIAAFVTRWHRASTFIFGANRTFVRAAPDCLIVGTVG
jgi:hypothetical protein